MNRKNSLITAAILAALVALVWAQFHAAGQFRWSEFLESARTLRLGHVLAGVGLIYLTYALRAVRWALLMRPVKDTSARRLVAPQFIGFSGLALFGRLGEFIRPYLIARREQVPFTSQLGLLTIERVFDMGAFGALFALNLLLGGGELRQVRHYESVHAAGRWILCFVLAVFLFVIAMRARGHHLEAWLERRQGGSGALGSRMAEKVRAFRDGLAREQGAGTLLMVAAVSCGIWLLVAAAYVLVTRAYPAMPDFGLPRIVLIMAFSVVGSSVQLPAVGGGSQLGTITAMTYLLGVDPALATSCGILLWLTTFASVTPAGLLLARSEHVSLSRLTRETAVSSATA